MKQRTRPRAFKGLLQQNRRLHNSDPMITSTERNSLKALGLRFIQIEAEVVTSAFFYGTFIPLFATSTVLFVDRRVRSHGTWLMFGTTVLSFLLVSVHWGADAVGSAVVNWKTLTETISGSVGAAGVLEFKRDVIMNWTMIGLLVVNDSIIVWRAWILCATRRSLVVGPFILLLGTFATSIAFVSLTSNRGGYNAYYAHGEPIRGTLLYASGALTAATNIVSTLLIAYRLWAYRKQWDAGILGSRWSFAQRILLMIIESGALYGILQLLTIFTFKKPVPAATLQAFYQAVVWEMYVQTTAMYPTIVLLLVEHKLSFTDMNCFASTTRVAPSGEATEIQLKSMTRTPETLSASQPNSVP